MHEICQTTTKYKIYLKRIKLSKLTHFMLNSSGTYVCSCRQTYMRWDDADDARLQVNKFLLEFLQLFCSIFSTF